LNNHRNDISASVIYPNELQNVLHMKMYMQITPPSQRERCTEFRTCRNNSTAQQTDQVCI